MDHFAGLDVSVKETSVCIVDDTGRIVRERKVASEPEALLAVLKNPAYHFKRIGLEAGPQRCARHRADDAGRALPPGACEDVTQSETADAADPSQATAVEGDRHRERPARYVAQLRSQGGHGGDGEVRDTHQRIGRELARAGCAGRTAACRPAGASRAARHLASPLAGYRA